MPFSEQTHSRAKELIARYPVGRERSALLPLLHLVQAEEGYVSGEGVTFCAEQLGLTRAQVGAVATFYTMYKRKPAGDWLVSVCTNTMCGVLGGDRTFEALAEYLGVGHDETTTDGSITIEHAECLAACDYAPVLTVNYEYFDKVQAEEALSIVHQLEEGERPVPSRGARLCTLKEMALQLAGFPEDREGALGDGPAGEPTLRGNRLAEQHGISVAGFDPQTPIPTQADREAAKTAPPPPAKTAPPPPAKAAARAAGPGPAPGAAQPTAPAGEPQPAQPATRPAKPEQPAEAAGLAQNKPASDAKPAGDAPAGQQAAPMTERLPEESA
ncbi:MAG: NADH-quinone oxidoreductase subunit [Micromonosporaceae bacterium]